MLHAAFSRLHRNVMYWYVDYHVDSREKVNLKTRDEMKVWCGGNLFFRNWPIAVRGRRESLQNLAAGGIGGAVVQADDDAGKERDREDRHEIEQETERADGEADLQRQHAAEPFDGADGGGEDE